VPPGFTPFR
uniref:Bradykinin-like peptide 1 n=3 Tax=Neobatrachia TaxID=8416 RepID=BRK1_PELNI|nr:RecName: Full=[Val1,Thr6]-bradykinin; Contains: RecName: Full=Des-Arg9-[Val1,Thr6]-bradykinin [Physalaemus nattereri]P84673.1 RecName: Full=[Val1,Thr6]-bradykinin [Phyllomedusa sauvagii]Q7LZ54.1 RecName: Full=Bradykinin-like peptide 1 [Pelophylax nigromaculatus]prf//680356A bradykinin,1-Val,6-Thr [Pelophylax nigromaculatus]